MTQASEEMTTSCSDATGDPAGTLRLLRETDEAQCDVSNAFVDRPFVLKINEDFELQICEGCAKILQIRLESALGPIKLGETDA